MFLTDVSERDQRVFVGVESDDLVALSANEIWVMLCQVEVGLTAVGNGDSGSPVFRWHPSGNVTLAGILWGSIPGGFRFSYFDLVQVELGPLQVF